MRKTGHALAISVLRNAYDHYRTELKTDTTAPRTKQKRARNVDYFGMNIVYGFNIARMGYLFDAPHEESLGALRRALLDVVVVLELGGTLSPISMRDYLGAALTLGDKRLIKWMSELPKSTYTDSGFEISPAGYLLIQAMQAGMKGNDKAFEAAVAKFRSSLDPKRLVVSPKSELAVYEPLADLLEAIAAKDQQRFEKAWAQQAKARNKRFARPSEKGNNEGILDFEALGLGRLAQQSKLTVPDSNPYAPTQLLDAGEAP
jgi:hypothetical protein